MIVFENIRYFESVLFNAAQLEQNTRKRLSAKPVTTWKSRPWEFGTSDLVFLLNSRTYETRSILPDHGYAPEGSFLSTQRTQAHRTNSSCVAQTPPK